MVGNKIVLISPLRDISWCFNPLFYWLRVLGIELNPTGNKYQKFSYIYGLAVLLICQWASIDITIYNFWIYPLLFANNTNTSSATYSLNVKIDYANHFFLMAIVSSAFFYVAQNRWLRLWELINVFECTYKIKHGKLRNFILAGFIPVAMEIGIIIYNLLVMLPDLPNESPYRKSAIIIAMFAKIVPISGMVLFCSTVWLTCLFYEEIQLDIDKNCKKVNRKNLRRWKCSLSLTSDIVDRINESFGLILLESITHFFIEFIARSFYLVNSISVTNVPQKIAVVGMISRIFLLWIIVYSPSKMYRNAIKAATSLRKIDSADSAMQNQVMLLVLDTLQNLPKISPLGYFDVDLQLVPKLTGTTLTYLIILYQFQSSEEKND